jgi:hypothetical protein
MQQKSKSNRNPTATIQKHLYCPNNGFQVSRRVVFSAENMQQKIKIKIKKTSGIGIQQQP